MRIAALILCLAVRCCFAGDLSSPEFLAGLLPAAAAAPAATNIFQENFEGPGYQQSNANGWTDVTSAIDEDYAGTPKLEGDQACRIAPSEFVFAPAPIAPRDEYYFKFRIRPNTLDNTFQFTLSRTGVDDCNIKLQTDGLWIVTHGSIGLATGSTVLVPGTEYFVWGRWVKGSGANGIIQLWVSTVNSLPGAPEIDANTGNGVNQPNLITIQGGNNTDVVIDEIQLRASPIP